MISFNGKNNAICERARAQTAALVRPPPELDNGARSKAQATLPVEKDLDCIIDTAIPMFKSMRPIIY